jgi:hypothetical protein
LRQRNQETEVRKVREVTNILPVQAFSKYPEFQKWMSHNDGKTFRNG